ncbi:MAG: GatB/YqeY domain-containing protein [bacterium]|nr:GatB/YqeY domain-containing protein [bacterium]
MPTIHEKIRDQVKEAMRARDTMRLNVVRGILSAFVNELIVQKKKPHEILPDPDALKVIKRLANQRKDSIEQFTKGSREDLVKIEEEELVLLQKYLPETMSKADIKKVAEKKQKELGYTLKADMGKLMGAVMKELKDSADGNDVKQVIEELFS